MWINTYLLETLIAEYAADLEREAARGARLCEPEPLRRPRGETLVGRLRRAAFALLPNRRTERMATR
jgi:hypothetical protein